MSLFDEILSFDELLPIGLNYMGAKKAIAPQLLQKMHELHFAKFGKKSKWFIDCFGGGASMSFAALQQGYYVIYNEMRVDLCRFFQAFKERKITLETCTREQWYALRDILPENRNLIEIIRSIFYSFNDGLCATSCGYSDEGFKENSVIVKMQNLIDCKNFNIHNDSYKNLNINQFLPSEVMIYADIPYQDKKSKKSYKGVYADAFNLSDFLLWCENLHKKGYKVYLSEYNAPSKDFKEILAIQKNTAYKRNEKLFVFEKDRQ